MKNIYNECLKTFKSLCTPAQLYFVLSTLSFLLILLQNCSDGSSVSYTHLTLPTSDLV